MAISPFILEANKYEPKMRSALIKAWNQLRTQESRAAIVRALQEGGVEAVMRMYQNIEPAIASQLSPVIDQALGAGASLPAAMIPAGAFLNKDVTISLFNQATVSFLERYKLDLIQQIGANTREAVRTSLIADQIAGINPVETARNFRNTLGLTAKQEQSVRNYKAYLENLDTQALQRQLRDKRFDPSIKSAIADQKPLSPEQIEKMTNRYRERYIKHRAETIARTEALRAVSIGNRAALDQMLANGDVDTEKLRRFWHYTGDSRTRQAHREVPGLNPKGRKLDEPFQTPLGSLMFPRDPMGSAENTIKCRCVEFYRLKLNDGKLKGPAPTDEKVNVTVDATPPIEDIKPKPFIPAASIKDAEKYAKDNGFGKTINFKDLPIEVANAMNQSATDTFELFPKFRGNIKYLGTSSGEEKKYAAYLKNQFRYFGYSPKELEDKIFDKLKEHRQPATTLAFYTPKSKVGFKFDGVSINDAWFKNSSDLAKFENAVKNCVDTNWHPVGTANARSIIDHEYGHAIYDYYVKPKKKSVEYLDKVFNDLGPIEIRNNLSKYAATDVGEFVSEAWAEYMNNPKPRPIAKSIGDWLMKNFAEKGAVRPLDK